MKINMANFYKAEIVGCGILAIIWLGYNGTVTIMAYESDYFWLFFFSTIFVVLLCATCPLVLRHRELTKIFLTEQMCTSFSITGKELCKVYYDRPVYYSIFPIQMLSTKPLRMIALSNYPFVCDQNNKGLFEKKFYGKYDRKKIVVFYYDEKFLPLLSFDSWQRVIAN